MIEKNQKISIIGPNGIGKTTLLKSIANLIPSLGGLFKASENLRFAYFSQHFTEQIDENLSILDAVLTYSNATPQEARSILGALLFKNDDVFKKINVLSGGEKNRVSLACTLSKKANMLLLDEPTNHLDIESIFALVKALKQYTGCVLLVSHNRAFINSISSHILACTSKRSLELFPGNLNDYSALSRSSDFSNVLEENLQNSQLDTKKKKMKTDFFVQKEIEKEKNKLKNRVKKLEKELEEIKNEIITLQHRMDTVIQEKKFSDLKKLNNILDQLKNQEEKKENEWIDINEKLE